MTNTTDDLRQKIISTSVSKSGSRLARLIRDPYRSLKPVLMRKMGWQENCDVQTVWGGTFSGVLPEAVSTVIWRNGFFDKYVSLTLLKFLRPGGQFIDIGAHFGYFSLFASSLVGPKGKVLSVEAMPSTFALLHNNMNVNAAYKNYFLHKGAAFDTQCQLEFNDYGLVASSLNSAFGNRGDKSLFDGKDKKLLVDAKPIDLITPGVGMKKIDLVKIDAESSEKFVLRGMEKTIEKYRPVIITEVGDFGVEDGFASSEQIDILKSMNYVPHKWGEDNQLHQFVVDGPVAYANLVFIPA